MVDARFRLSVDDSDVADADEGSGGTGSALADPAMSCETSCRGISSDRLCVLSGTESSTNEMRLFSEVDESARRMEPANAVDGAVDGRRLVGSLSEVRVDATECSDAFCSSDKNVG